MNDTKPWWQSQTIWGSLVAIAAVIASFFGINLDQPAQDALLSILAEVVALGGAVVALIGRLRASAQVKLK
jgi:Mg2+ and Co2+ transporter CorA